MGFIVVGLCGLGVSAALVLSAFNKNLVFFFTPSQVAAKEAPTGRYFRIGGLVQKGSLQRDADGLTSRFMIADAAKNIPGVFNGLLAGLFQEGPRCVGSGKGGPKVR